MTTGKRPLTIVHAIARLNVGGAALHVIELAAEQRRRGHEVVVVAGTLAEGEESMEYLAHELAVPVVSLPELQRELSVTRDAVAIRELRRVIARRRPDVLHTHTAKAGTAGRAAARLARRGGRPVTVHTFHGHVLRGYFDSRRERFFVHIERSLARHTGALVAVSAEVRDDLVALGVAPADRIAVIPYGFDLSRLSRPGARERNALRAEVDVGRSTFVIGFAGRLTAIKRPLDLVRVLASVRARDVDAALVVLGDGPDRAAVEELARELGVAGACRFLGFRRDVARWYGAFDAFLLTSENEGTPVVAIEALAAECPVVATDAGGTATVVSHGETGLLAPIGDTEALAAHLEALAREPALGRRLGRAGAADVRSRFATERMADAIDDLYAQLIDP
jgi:glycosyltransferase involved in cell wall biosynthesis